MNSKKAIRPFLGEETTFAKKYPQIKSVRIEYEQMENRLPKDERKGTLSELWIQPTLKCGWKRCHEGGFPIESQIISRMVYEGLTELEGTIHCVGHEMLGGKTKGYHCTNYIEYKAMIEYQNSAE